MPILGSIASQNTKSFLFAPSGAYDSIATTTVGSGGTSSITFSSIPQTYRHLQLRITARNTRVSGYLAGTLRGYLNGDTANNYTDHILYGADGGAGSFATVPSGGFNVARVADNSVANAFGVSVVDILDYTNANKNTTVRALSGYESSGGGELYYFSSLWLNTAAITSITIDTPSFNIMQYSSIALYGIKGA